MKEKIRKWIGKLKDLRLGTGIARNFKVFSLIFLVLLAIAMSTTDITDQSITTPTATVTTGSIDDLTSLQMNSSQIFIGNTSGFSGQAANRPLISNNNVSVTVCASGCSYTTIQAALNDIPIFLRHKYLITIGDGNYNENLWIPPSIIEDITDLTEGSVEGLRITGNLTDRNLVSVTSIHIADSIGSQSPTIDNMTITGVDPWSDENVSISVYGSSHAVLRFLNITASAEYGIQAYGSSITITDIDFGNNNLENALLVKHGGQIYSINIPSYGNVLEYPYLIAGGNIYAKNDNIVGGVGTFFTSSTTTGTLLQHNINDRILWGVTEFGNQLTKLNMSSSDNSRTVEIIASGNTSSDYQFYFKNSGLGRGAMFYQSNSADTNTAVEIQSDGNSTGLLLDQNGAGGIALDIDSESDKPPIRIQTNATDILCSITYAGGIYYDGVTNHTYMCNSTNWKQMDID